jgi:hypothetical protein
MRISIRTVTLGVVLALAVLGMPSVASADPINVSDGWHKFSWLGGPNVSQSQSPFTFTSATAVTVQVTDAYVAGDRFELFDNAASQGLTSTPNNLSQPWTADPSAAWLGTFSKGSFTLAAGSHSLVLKNVQIPNNIDSGAAYFRVLGPGDNVGVSEVAPEPGTLALVGIGLAGFAVRRRLARRRDVAIA